MGLPEVYHGSMFWTRQAYGELDDKTYEPLGHSHSFRSFTTRAREMALSWGSVSVPSIDPAWIGW